MIEQSLVERLTVRAEIRRQIPSRKSVQENQPDRIADLLEEAAEEIKKLQAFKESVYGNMMKKLVVVIAWLCFACIVGVALVFIADDDAWVKEDVNWGITKDSPIR